MIFKEWSTLLEEDIHNTQIQAEVLKLEHFNHCEEDCKVSVVRVKASLHWMMEGDESSKFYFNFLKKNNSFENIFGVTTIEWGVSGES